MEKTFQLKIFLDDIREAPDGYLTVRSYLEFCHVIADAILSNTPIEEISLDHDLGNEITGVIRFRPDGKIEITDDVATGYDALKFALNKLVKKKIPLIRIHSANQVGVDNMIGYINAFARQHNGQQIRVQWGLPELYLLNTSFKQ